MSVESVTNLLDRYKKLVLPKESVRKETVRLISNICGVYLPVDSIDVINGCVYIHGSTDLKKNISKNKKTLLEEFSNIFGVQAPKDIC